MTTDLIQHKSTSWLPDGNLKRRFLSVRVLNTESEKGKGRGGESALKKMVGVKSNHMDKFSFLCWGNFERRNGEGIHNNYSLYYKVCLPCYFPNHNLFLLGGFHLLGEDILT